MSELIAFAGLSISIIVIPGANTLLVIQNTLERGARSGLLTLLGGNLGILAQGLVVAFGLSLQVLRAPTLVTTLKAAGGIFLLYLGARFIWTALRPNFVEDSPTPRHRTIYEAFVAYVLTAETAIFFLTVTPQFIHPDSGDSAFLKTLFFTLLYIALRVVWMLVVIAFSAQLRSWLQTPRVRSTIQLISGAIVLIFGMRLLVI